MILEDATKEAFGYYPNDLKPQSNKRLWMCCIQCGEFRITTKAWYHMFCQSCAGTFKMLSEEHKCKIGEAQKGVKVKCICPVCGKDFEVLPSGIKAGRGKYCSRKCKDKAQKANICAKNHFFGKKHTEATKAQISASEKGKKESEETCRKKSIAAIKRMHNSPHLMTAPEKVFEEMCCKFDLPLVCNVVAGKTIDILVPDFIHKTKKIVVEVFGDYWHGAWLGFKNLKYKHTDEGKRKLYKAQGYKLIVFWESDLMRQNADKFVLRTLKKEKII